MKITLKQLTALGACTAGKLFVKKQKDRSLRALVSAALTVNSSWVHWLLVRLMTHPQKVMYAVHSAELVIGLYEKRYPNDDRPRKAIDAALKFVLDPSAENRSAANAVAANAAAYAADAADAADAANAAAYAADAAAYAADAAASAAADAANAAADAANAAAYAADAAASAAADAATHRKIADYGLFLLGE